MVGGLTIEVEEEVQLLENAATASLFSPGMWVQRPQMRTPAAAPRDAELGGHTRSADSEARGSLSIMRQRTCGFSRCIHCCQGT
jgi:hypothetical protein